MTPHSSTRKPQLDLRLDGVVPDPADRWREGAPLAYLGEQLTLTLDTVVKDTYLDGTVLHLPLPPQASPRQIQDRAEAWLRSVAKQRLGEIIGQKSALAGRRPPQLALSFSAHGHWADVRGVGSLRCNWRLIEQPLAVIEQVIGRAVAALPDPEHTRREADLFVLSA